MRESYVIASIEGGTTLFASRYLNYESPEHNTPWRMSEIRIEKALFFDTVEEAVTILTRPDKWETWHRPQLHTFKVYKVSLEEVKL